MGGGGGGRADGRRRRLTPPEPEERSLWWLRSWVSRGLGKARKGFGAEGQAWGEVGGQQVLGHMGTMNGLLTR